MKIPSPYQAYVTVYLTSSIIIVLSLLGTLAYDEMFKHFFPIPYWLNVVGALSYMIYVLSMTMSPMFCEELLPTDPVSGQSLPGKRLILWKFVEWFAVLAIFGTYVLYPFQMWVFTAGFHGRILFYIIIVVCIFLRQISLYAPYASMIAEHKERVEQPSQTLDHQDIPPLQQ